MDYLPKREKREVALRGFPPLSKLRKKVKGKREKLLIRYSCKMSILNLAIAKGLL
jgi:hypothetical protein